MRTGLPRERRIRSRREIAEILRSGERWRCVDFVIVYRRSESSFHRFAVLVSKRHGNAVERNRIKRIYREVFREARDESLPPMDILFRPHYERARSSRVADIGAAFDQWIQKLGS